MQEVVTNESGAREVSRREFLATSAAIAAGTGLTLNAQAQGDKKAADGKPAPLNVALIGFGAEGRVLVECLIKIHAAGTIRLTSIVDVWPYALNYGEKYLKTQGIEVKSYVDHEELLKNEKDLHAVVIATPDFWHAPITNDCLKAGLHVYCEKMMSNTAAAAKSMVTTMKETGKLLQIGHQRRSSPRYIFALNRLMNEQRICGRVTAVNAQWNRAVSEDLKMPKGKSAAMSPEQLKKYGFDNEHEFRNWRWFKKYGGGPLSDLGAHQIDIFNWWLDAKPKSVVASGGLDFYKTHEWFDNAMVIYEYDLPLKDKDGKDVMDEAGKPMTYTARAFYQVQTTTSAGGGYWEYFMGTDGSLKMSENPKLAKIYKEANADQNKWDTMVANNYLRPAATPPPAEGATVDVRETAQLAQYEIPVSFNKLIHQPHLENFFYAVQTKDLPDTDPKKVKLTCPADEAYRSEIIIFKAIDAIHEKKQLTFTPADFEC